MTLVFYSSFFLSLSSFSFTVPTFLLVRSLVEIFSLVSGVVDLHSTVTLDSRESQGYPKQPPSKRVAKFNFTMPSSRSFHLFSALPPEIQLQVWDAAASCLELPSMHMLDINAPSPTPNISDLRLQGDGVVVSTTVAANIGNGRQRPRLPPRNSSSSHASQSRICKVRKRTPSPPSNRRNGAYFDTAVSTCFMENTNNTTVNLSALDVGTTTSSFDPSMYKFRESLLATCVDAANSVSKRQILWSPAVSPSDREAVHLPSGTRFTYNNNQDVLYLRFVLDDDQSSSPPPPSPPASPETPPPPPTTSSPPTLLPMMSSSTRFLHKGIASSASPISTHPLSAIFQALWSPDLAKTLHTARRIAIDVSQIWPALGSNESEEEQEHYQSRLVQDIVFLACTIQNDLEVLYLVEDSSRRCFDTCNNKDVSRKPSPLYRALYPSKNDLEGGHNDNYRTEPHMVDEALEEEEPQRQPDVIHGAGKVWRETFDLEALGWHDKHPGFVFGETMSEVVRLQQGNWHGQGEKRPTFKGVRVLVAED